MSSKAQSILSGLLILFLITIVIMLPQSLSFALYIEILCGLGAVVSTSLLIYNRIKDTTENQLDFKTKLELQNSQVKQLNEESAKSFDNKITSINETFQKQISSLIEINKQQNDKIENILKSQEEISNKYQQLLHTTETNYKNYLDIVTESNLKISQITTDIKFLISTLEDSQKNFIEEYSKNLKENSNELCLLLGNDLKSNNELIKNTIISSIENFKNETVCECNIVLSNLKDVSTDNIETISSIMQSITQDIKQSTNDIKINNENSIQKLSQECTSTIREISNTMQSIAQDINQNVDNIKISNEVSIQKLSQECTSTVEEMSEIIQKNIASIDENSSEFMEQIIETIDDADKKVNQFTDDILNKINNISKDISRKVDINNNNFLNQYTTVVNENEQRMEILNKQITEILNTQLKFMHDIEQRQNRYDALNKEEINIMKGLLK